MPLMVQRSDHPIGSSRFHHHHHHIRSQSNLPYSHPSFHLPGAFTISEEPEDLSLSRPSSSSNNSLRSRAPSINSQQTISASDKTLSLSNANRSKQMMKSSLQTPELVLNDDKNSSAFHLSEQRTPTTAMIANEREANMRTPRPHSAAPTSSEGRFAPEQEIDDNSNSSNTKARILQWQRRRDASDATVEPAKILGTTVTKSTNELAKSAPAETTSYPTDSLGKMSTHSSLYTSGSEFGGHGLRVASESGHQHHLSTASNMMRKGRKIAPPELLVVVRPPPSKQGNPLNLQIQLVTPNQGGPSGGRISGESSRDDMPTGDTSGNLTADSIAESTNGGKTVMKTPPQTIGLRRSNSVSSSRSAYSESSSAGFSTTSSSSNARRVTPLYNLNFHSLMPTTVNDAGTDQKVAKFGKRYVDIDGFGQLVPHELALGVNDLASVNRRRRRSFLSNSPSGRADSGSGVSDFNSPTEVRSDVSQTRSTEATTMHSDVESGSGSGIQLTSKGKNAEPPTSFDAMSPQAKESPTDPISGLGNKLMRGFKRLSVATPITSVSPSKSNHSVRSSTTTLDTSRAPTSIISRMRGAATAPSNKGKENHDNNSHFTQQTDDSESLADHQNNFENESDIPQLVVGAGLKSDGNRRTQGYYWTVKRWNRRLDENVEEDLDDLVPGRREPGSNPILNSVWKRFNVANRMGGTEIHPPAAQIPVRFEWTRNEIRKKSSHSHNGNGHARAATELSGSHPASRRGSVAQVRSASRSRTDLENITSQDSTSNNSGIEVLKSSPDRNANGSGPGSASGGSGTGGGFISPFRRSIDRSSMLSGGAGEEEESDPEDSETKWACHLVLGPTTRIPIGSLAPTPHHPKLVAQLTVPYPLPDLSQSGLGVDGAGLTREELKDIISVTALFVIVREAFGGLAKRRKGDSVIKFGAAAAQR